MATISLTLPVAGNVITAGLHATNYTAIQTFANGGIDNNNVSGSAALAYSKLNLANSLLLSDISTGAGNAWTAYTPAWTSSGSAPALGNGAIAGKWVQIGKTIIGRALLTMGTTTTYGTGTYSLSLPTAAAAGETLQVFSVGQAVAVDTGVLIYPAISLLATTTTVNFYTNAGVAFSPTAPFTFGPTDTLSFRFQYEAA